MNANRCHGVSEIVRFNWPSYASGVAAIALGALAATILPLPRWSAELLVAATSLAAFWIVASLLASHWAYDRSPLRQWEWIAPALGYLPRRWINLHAGLDESTPKLRKLFAGASGRTFDFFDPAQMTEPSIRRARDTAAIVAEPARFDSLPLRDGECDAAFLLLSAHELRRPAVRVAMLREVRRVLTEGGRVIVAEHLRDLANFIAFGPGAFHFHSRRTWHNDFAAAGLRIKSEFRITPFIAIFVLGRLS
jgi:SAM-dependent methyltransferase